MSAAGVMARHTVGRLRNRFSTALSVAVFLAASGLAYVFALEAANGTPTTAPAIWAAAIAPLVPYLVAVLGMSVWSDELLTGRIENLMSVAVRERELVVGKFFGVVITALGMLALTLVMAMAATWWWVPSALAATGVSSMVASYLALVPQTVLWCAITVAASACFRHGAVAACVAAAITSAVPRIACRMLTDWLQRGSNALGEFPLDAQVVDMASGVVATGTLAAYAVWTVLALFIASKRVASYRLSGRGSLSLRVSTTTTVALAIAVGLLFTTLVHRFDPTLEISLDGASHALSQRTRSILAESREALSITAFMSRGDARFRTVSRLMRRIKREAASIGGVGVNLGYVDPHWDVGVAERMVRRGLKPGSVIFESGSHVVSVPIDEGYGERLWASTLRKISMPSKRCNVCWTVGHGEIAFDDYSGFGMSDIAREMSREGFVNAKLDLAAAKAVPRDCALVMVAGARDDFSRAEIDRLESYLKDGGRLMVLTDRAKSGGLASVLPAWGMRPEERPLDGVRTMTGSDVIVTEFTDHDIAAPLKGSRVVLERPLTLTPSAVTGISYSPIAEVGGAAVAAAVERGVGAGGDLALRPSRMVVIGDAGFAVNEQLQMLAGANRDLMLNAVSYLAGVDVHGTGEGEGDRLAVLLDRNRRHRLLATVGGVMPLAYLLVLALAARRRRIRR